MHTENKRKSVESETDNKPPQLQDNRYSNPPPKSLQENMLTALCYLPKTGKYVLDRVSPNLFEGDYRIIAEQVVNYWKKYAKPPRNHTADLLADIIDDPNNRKRRTYERILHSMSELAEKVDGKFVNINTKFIRDETNTFIKMQHLTQAIIQSARHLETKQPAAIAAVEEIWTKLLQGGGQQAQRVGVTNEACARDLQAMDFPALKYVVAGYIVEGLTLLAAKPKTGKSWLMLGVSLVVSDGGVVFGSVECKQGAVLYCALEDGSLRRCQYRIKKLLSHQKVWPEHLTLVSAMPRLDDGGLTYLQSWVKRVKRPRLIIIDTLKMVRKPVKDRGYDADYDSVSALRDFAVANHIAVVLVHHLRKAEAEDDALDTVSGTLGLTGAVDTVLVLKRKGDKVTMHGRGRDLPEIEKAMAFDAKRGVWTVLGDAEQVHQSQQRARILRTLRAASEPLKPNTIARDCNMSVTNVQFLLGKLINSGEVERVGYGQYRTKQKPRESDDEL